MNQPLLAPKFAFEGLLSREDLTRILNLTQRIFPGPVAVEREFDPAEPDSPWVVFEVKVGGERKELMDRYFQWHDEIEKFIPGHSPQIRLAVYAP